MRIPSLAGVLTSVGIMMAALQSLYRSEAVVSAIWFMVLLTCLILLARGFRRGPPAAQISGVPAWAASAAPQHRGDFLGADMTEFDVAAAPRSLTSDPWSGGDPVLTIDQRVRIAIEASLRHSRVLGVIYLQVYAPGGRGLVEEKLLAAMKSRLRRTDHVEISSAGVIIEAVVYVPLLRQRSDLANIAERLRNAAAAMTQEDAGVQVSRPGIALNPIDGYSRADLVAAARLDMNGEAFCVTGASTLPLPAPRRGP